MVQVRHPRKALAALLLLAGLLALAACDRAATTALPTLAATVAAAPTPTETPPAATATPPAATATPAETPEPTFTPGPSPTPELAALVAAAVAPQVIADLPLPGLAWRAEVIRFECTPVGENVGDGSQPYALEILRLVDAAGVEYQIDSQLLACGGLGAFGLEPLVWGNSGRYFWYTTAREGGPDGACRPWARPMTRVDLADWAVTTLDSAALAPFGQRVAGWVNGELVIFAVDGGELGRLAPPALPPLVGAPVWSPDGSAIAYLQYSSTCGETAGDSAVILVNTDTFEQRVLLTQSAPEFAEVSWLDGGHLSLGGLMDSGQWVYDLASGVLSPAP